MFGDIWPNVVIDVSHWKAGPAADAERASQGVTKASYSRELIQIFRNKFKLTFDPKVVFLDAKYDRDSEYEVNFFEQEANELHEVFIHESLFSTL